MIPTSGRIVHFTPTEDDNRESYKDQPHAAVVTYVHSPELVNLYVYPKFDGDPAAGLQTSVQMKTESMTSFCWEWPKREG